MPLARYHSERMAAAGTIWHTPDLTSQVSGWKYLGENVGVGPTVDALHTAFMNSPPHRANIIDPDFTEVAVGVAVDSSGQIYVTEIFFTPKTAVAAAPPASQPPPPAPPPAPVPAATSHTPKATVRRRTKSASPRAHAHAQSPQPVATQTVTHPPSTVPVVCFPSREKRFPYRPIEPGYLGCYLLLPSLAL